jgi:hypothetical protein
LQRSNVGSFKSHRIVAVVTQTIGKMPKPLVHCCYENLRHSIYSYIKILRLSLAACNGFTPRTLRTPTDGIVLYVSLRFCCIILTNNQDEAHIHNADSRPCFHILSRRHSPALDSIWLLDQLGVNLL